MASQYQNVFFYFRGPTSRAAPGSAEVQLEDNTTKALINLLQYGDGLTDSLLSWLKIGTSGDGSWEYYLQRGPDQTESARSRQLLVLATEPPPREMRFDQTAVPEEERRGRVDAALYRPGQQLIVVECKVTAALDPAQLLRHSSDWNVLLPSHQGHPSPEWHFATWGDVFVWTRREIASEHNPVTRFLLEQFSDYLALIGVAPEFAGFRAEDFQYLKRRRNAIKLHPRPQPDPLQERLIKDRLEKLWLAVRKALGPEAEPLGTTPPRAGNLRGFEDKVWALGSRDHERRDLKPALELSPDGLELSVTGGTNEQAARFERIVHDAAGRVALSELSDYELVVMRRIGQRAGPSVVFRGARWEKLDRTTPAELASRGDGLIQKWKKQRLDEALETIAYQLRRTWDAQYVLAAREAIADEVGAALSQVLPLINAANSPGV